MITVIMIIIIIIIIIIITRRIINRKIQTKEMLCNYIKTKLYT